MKNENEKNDAKQGLLIDAETDLLSHPSTLECVSPNSGILFPNLFGASSERITLYKVGPKDVSAAGYRNLIRGPFPTTWSIDNTVSREGTSWSHTHTATTTVVVNKQ